MSTPHELGKEAFGEPLIPSEFERTSRMAAEDRLWTLDSNRDLIIRSAGQMPAEVDASVSEVLGIYTSALFDLSDKFDIHHPAISFAHEPSKNGEDRWFIAAGRVEGVNLGDGIQVEHRDIAQNAFENILKYHRSMMENNAFFLMDLSMRQLVYGTTASNSEPAVYMVDFELGHGHFMEINDGNREMTLVMEALMKHKAFDRDVEMLGRTDPDRQEANQTEQLQLIKQMASWKPAARAELQ